MEVPACASLLVMVSANSMPWLAASQRQKLCHGLRWSYIQPPPVRLRHSSCRQPPLVSDQGVGHPIHHGTEDCRLTVCWLLLQNVLELGAALYVGEE